MKQNSPTEVSWSSFLNIPNEKNPKMLVEHETRSIGNPRNTKKQNVSVGNLIFDILHIYPGNWNVIRSPCSNKFEFWYPGIEYILLLGKVKYYSVLGSCSNWKSLPVNPPPSQQKRAHSIMCTHDAWCAPGPCARLTHGCDHPDRLRDHPSRVREWESVCWGVLGIRLLENEKV